MPVALACASHTPMLLDPELAGPEVCAAVKQSFATMADFIDRFEPDLIVQFSPDHFHGFHYGNMPSFCIGAAARSFGDWGTAKGLLRVDEPFALALLDAVRSADIDAAVSHDMVVDHGFVQIWQTMWGGFDRYPIVPVFVNAIAHPVPTYRRARALGEAIGRHAVASGRRVLFAASGGLSHDPAIPTIEGASPALRERLTGRATLDPEQQKARQAQVRAAAVAARDGVGTTQPLNPEWDRAFLDLLRTTDWASTDAFDPLEIRRIAGSGANEVLCWVAATAAMATAGPFEIVQQDYVAVPGWIAGMAHLAACESHDGSKPHAFKY